MRSLSVSIEYAASATNAWRNTYSCSPLNFVTSRRVTISRSQSSSSHAVTWAPASSEVSKASTPPRQNV